MYSIYQSPLPEPIWKSCRALVLRFAFLGIRARLRVKLEPTKGAKGQGAPTASALQFEMRPLKNKNKGKGGKSKR